MSGNHITSPYHWLSIDRKTSSKLDMPNDSIETRASLLLQLRNRDDSVAWSRLVELYTPLLDHWVGKLGFDDADRSDLVQEVFIVLLGKVSTFQYDCDRTFRGWLRTVTVNKCRDFARRAGRKSEPQLLRHIERAAEDETELLTQQEYRDFLARSALRLMRIHFSETTWRACWEHVANGRSAAEVAEELGISQNAVYLARGRVLTRLRQELEGLWE